MSMAPELNTRNGWRHCWSVYVSATAANGLRFVLTWHLLCLATHGHSDSDTSHAGFRCGWQGTAAGCMHPQFADVHAVCLS